jgi:hypothetical protein
MGESLPPGPDNTSPKSRDVGEIERLAGVGGDGVFGVGVGVGAGAGAGADFLQFFFDATADRFFLHFFLAAVAGPLPELPAVALAAAVAATSTSAAPSAPNLRPRRPPFMREKLRSGAHQALIAPDLRCEPYEASTGSGWPKKYPWP